MSTKDRDCTGYGPNERPTGDTGGSPLGKSNASMETNPGTILDGVTLQEGYKPMGSIKADTKSDEPDFA